METYSLEALLGKRLVHGSGLESKALGGVVVLGLVLGRLDGRLGNSEKVELGVVTLVQEEPPSNALGNNIPRIHGSCGCHQRCQDGVRCEDCPHTA